MSNSVFRSILTCLWLIVALLLLMSLISYSVIDPSWSYLSSHGQKISNLAGVSGAWLSDILYTMFGVASWWLVVMACYEGWQVWRNGRPHGIIRLIGYVVILSMTAICVSLLNILQESPKMGGMIGNSIALILAEYATAIGAIVLVSLLLAFILAYVFDIRQIFYFNKYRKQAIEADAQAIYDYLKQTNHQNPALTMSSLTDENVQQDTVSETPKKTTSPKFTPTGSVLGEFLHETGFNDERNNEWEANHKSNNAFLPVGSTYLNNAKLTGKLDKKLQEETIKANNFDKVHEPKPKPSKKYQSENVTTFQPTTPSVIKNYAFEQSLSPADDDDMIEEIEQTVENFDTDNATNVEQTTTETIVEMDNSGVLIDEQDVDIFAQLPKIVPTIIPQPINPVEPIATFETVEAIEPLPIAEPIDENPPLYQPENEQNNEQNHFENPTDIHNDALFAHKSRAMQTAKYRDTLSPIPDWSLLDLPDANRQPSYTPQQLQQLSELLEIKLQEFNIKSTVVNAQMGPVVTRFEVELAPGVKASKVTSISRDLARSLSMASVRVVEVIPGKPYIGIEIPNAKREMVRLIELLETPAFKDPEGLLSMAMGKDISGRPVISDLAKAPHMLVAGTTGSGKSVLVNSLLLSLLLKYTPTDLRLILIDPKQLELANYNDIPHLLTPVITDMTEATGGLAWCVAEMERRYQLMSLFKVRKLAEFNKKVVEAEQNGLPLLDPLWRLTDSATQDKPPKLKPLPQIVIVADEFADMIMQIGKPAEELITRLAQKSRAAGIHLILATQRPSVDVITGLIKANIPVRCGLRVNSKVDSRTILDAGGAEDMLGHGDMLFLGPGQNEPIRVHGAFISDHEVNRVCDAWRERGSPDYVDNMFDSFDASSSGTSNQSDNSGGGTFGDDDPLYDEVVAFVMETRKVSSSSIQRKFSIGYNRAARIVDAMEQAGLVGAMGKNGKRELLI